MGLTDRLSNSPKDLPKDAKFAFGDDNCSKTLHEAERFETPWELALFPEELTAQPEKQGAVLLFFVLLVLMSVI